MSRWAVRGFHVALVLTAALLPPVPAAVDGASAGVFLPLKFHSGPKAPWRAGRILLRSERADIMGSVHDGYFTASLAIGTPAKSFDVIIDTGSTMTYVPCESCEHCGKHTSKAYDPAASRTARRLTCSEPACKGTKTATCAQGLCYYSLAYAESSSSEGWLIQDVVSLSGSAGPPVPAVVGCTNWETGMIYDQRADGLIGLGNAKQALPRQLAASGQLSHVFGLCFGFPSGGAVLLGDAPLPAGVAPPSWTPLLPTDTTFYVVRLDAIEIDVGEQYRAAASGQLPPGGAPSGGADQAVTPRRYKAVEVDSKVYSQGYGTVMDSGTTFNYLPTKAFDALSGVIIGLLALKGMMPISEHLSVEDSDICWKVDNSEGGPAAAWAAASEAFPSMRLKFGGGASLDLPPQRYLFAVAGGRRFCLGFFDNGDDGTLIGGLAVRDVLVVYDMVKNRIGFSEADCDNLVPSNASSASGAGQAPPRPTITGGDEAAAPAGGKRAPAADAAAAAAEAKGRGADLVADRRPQAPVTAAMRQQGAAGAGVQPGGGPGTRRTGPSEGPQQQQQQQQEEEAGEAQETGEHRSSSPLDASPSGSRQQQEGAGGSSPPPGSDELQAAGNATASEATQQQQPLAAAGNETLLLPAEPEQNQEQPPASGGSRSNSTALHGEQPQPQAGTNASQAGASAPDLPWLGGQQAGAAASSGSNASGAVLTAAPNSSTSGAPDTSTPEVGTSGHRGPSGADADADVGKRDAQLSTLKAVVSAGGSTGAAPGSSGDSSSSSSAHGSSAAFFGFLVAAGAVIAAVVIGVRLWRVPPGGELQGGYGRRTGFSLVPSDAENTDCELAALAASISLDVEDARALLPGTPGRGG